jgi:uncharacterized protein
MARQDCEIYNVDGGGSNAQTSDAFLRLGMQYATGSEVEPDLVTAHKWLNIAAIRGSQAALRHRREIAAEMTKAEIDEALRQARAWLNPR